MRKMLILTGVLGAVCWGTVTAWAGGRPAPAPLTRDRLTETAVPAPPVLALPSSEAAAPTDRTPAAQPLVVTAEPVEAAVAVAEPVAPAVDEAPATTEAAPAAVPVVRPRRTSAPVTDAPAVAPIVETTPMLHVLPPAPAPVVSALTTPAAVAPAAPAPTPVPEPAATRVVVLCGGPDGWTEVPDTSACPGDRALRIQREPVGV